MRFTDNTNPQKKDGSAVKMSYKLNQENFQQSLKIKL